MDAPGVEGRNAPGALQTLLTTGAAVSRSSQPVGTRWGLIPLLLLWNSC